MARRRAPLRWERVRKRRQNYTHLPCEESGLDEFCILVPEWEDIDVECPMDEENSK
jgi:hypothetical protein